jgi:hypothetical protein
MPGLKCSVTVSSVSDSSAWGCAGARRKEETDSNFTIDWKRHYRIEGDAFVFVDRKTRGTRAILGYPTQKLQHIKRG